MASPDVSMNIPDVENMSKVFNTMGDVAKAISKALKIIIMTLKGMAFISFGATTALEQYLSRIQPRIEKLGEKFEELSGDLDGAIRSYRDGDSTGSQRFA
ncbi:MAG: hypothetical protein IPK52_04880 [Chloroflexi bacterium]|nr:hypothetical protein [Chloroflexota bacterium]